MSGHPDGYRADIQGLRGVAVAAVLVYHLWPGAIPAGFIGVDLFFVISGYLIIGALARKVRADGHVGLLDFWARRAKRLLPSALLVLTVSALATARWVPRTRWGQFFAEIKSAAVYVQNWRLAADAVDYNARSNRVSPVLHYWSLSVEEQCYIAVPLLIALVVLIGPHLRLRRGAALAAMVAALITASAAWCIWLTSTNRPRAYFSTAARGWEFGLGGLASLLAVRPARRLAGVVVGAGAAMIAWSAVAMPAASFPGWVAAVPVLATAGLLVAMPFAARPLSQVVSWRPLRDLGDISYSVYLWHWPLIVLLPFVTGRPLGTGERFGVLASTLALGWATTRWFENPLRFSPRLLGSGRRPLVVLASTMLAAGALLGGARLATNSIRRPSPAAQLGALSGEVRACLGAHSLLASCAGVVPVGALVPDALAATADRIGDYPCKGDGDHPQMRLCSFGPSTAARRLLAVGDSHTYTLIPALERIAATRGWRIDVTTHVSCYWTTAAISLPLPRQTRACASWRGEVTRLVRAGGYQAVVVTNARSRDDSTAAAAAAVDGYRAAWTTARSAGTAVIAVEDVANVADIADCLERDPATGNERCSVPRGVGLGPDAMLDAASGMPGVSTIRTDDVTCPGGRCLAVIGHVPVYRDGNHLTRTFAVTLDNVLGDRLAAALDMVGS